MGFYLTSFFFFFQKFKTKNLQAKAMNAIETRVFQLSNESQIFRERLDEETKNRIALEKRVEQLEAKLSAKEEVFLPKIIVDSIKENVQILVESNNASKCLIFIAAMKKAGIVLPFQLTSLRTKISKKTKQVNQIKTNQFTFNSKTIPLDFMIEGKMVYEKDIDHSLFNVSLWWNFCPFLRNQNVKFSQNLKSSNIKEKSTKTPRDPIDFENPVEDSSESDLVHGFQLTKIIKPNGNVLFSLPHSHKQFWYFVLILFRYQSSEMKEKKAKIDQNEIYADLTPLMQGRALTGDVFSPSLCLLSLVYSQKQKSFKKIIN